MIPFLITGDQANGTRILYKYQYFLKGNDMLQSLTNKMTILYKARIDYNLNKLVMSYWHGMYV